MSAKLIAIVVLVFASQAAYSDPLLDLGGLVNGLLSNVLGSLKGVVNSLSNAANGLLGGLIDIGGGTKVDFGAVTSGLQGIVSEVTRLANTNALSGKNLSDISKILEEIEALIKKASQSALNDTFDAKASADLTANLKPLIDQLRAKLSASGVFSGPIMTYIQNVQTALDAINKTSNGLLSGLLGGIAEILNGVLQAVFNLLNQLLSAVNNTDSPLKGAFADVVTDLGNALTQVKSLIGNGKLNGTALTNVKSIVEQIETTLQSALSKLASGKTLEEVLDTVGPTLKSLIAQLETSLNDAGGAGLDALLNDLVSNLDKIINGNTDSNNLVGTITDVVGNLNSQLLSSVDAALQPLQSLLKPLTDLITELIAKLTAAGEIVA